MRPVRTFAIEREMVDVLRSHLFDALPEATTAPAFKVLAWPAVGARIPDLVVLYSRRSAGAAETVALTYFEADVLGKLLEGSPRGISPGQLEDVLFATPQDVATVLSKLERLSLVTRIGQERFSARRAAFPREVEVVAVEAKLTRWREALEQAQSYLKFANRSFVAMPGSVARGNYQLLTECARNGIGVVAVDPVSTSVVLEAARHTQHGSGERVRLIANSFGLHQTVCR